MANGFQLTPITPAVTTVTAVTPSSAVSGTSAAAAVEAAANAQASSNINPARAILIPGQTITAQVSQALENGAVRVTTPAGTIDIKPSIPLPVGVAVVIQVPQGNAPLKLSVPASVAPIGAAVSANIVNAGLTNNQRFATTANSLNAQSMTFMAEMASAQQSGRIPSQMRDSIPELPKNQIPQQVSDIIRQVVGQAVTGAVTRQDSLLPLFTSLKQAVAHFSPPIDLGTPRTPSVPMPQKNAVNPLVESVFPHRAQHINALQPQNSVLPLQSQQVPQLPQAVLQAVERVLATQVTFGQAPNASNIRDALIQSGLFLQPLKEGQSVPIQGMGLLSSTPTVDAALKLLGFPPQSAMPSPAAIEKALANIITQDKVGNISPPVTAGLAGSDAITVQKGMGVATGSTVPMVEAIARLVGITLPAGSPVTLDMLKQAVSRAALHNQNGSSTKPVSGMQTSPIGGGNALPALTTTDLKSSLSGLRHALMQWLGPNAGAVQAVSAIARRPSPPRPEGNPVPQILQEALIAKDMNAQQFGAKLLAQTEAALARQGLLQWASLPEGAERSMGRVDGGASPVVFEVPAFMNNQNAVIQFHIEHDRDEGNEGENAETEKTWQAKFAVAFEPLGAVHAHITLRGDVANVTLWAEQEFAAEVLKSQMLDLRDALASAQFEVHDVVCKAGAPIEKAAAALKKASRGYFLDQKT